jgi:hypothetical protein
MCEEIHQLRALNGEQYRMIRRLKDQSLLWKSLAEIRAEVIRNLRTTLGMDPEP